jgi:hypothetical protein
MCARELALKKLPVMETSHRLIRRCLLPCRLGLFCAQLQAFFSAFASSIDLFCPVDLLVSAHKTSKSLKIYSLPDG